MFSFPSGLIGCQTHSFLQNDYVTGIEHLVVKKQCCQNNSEQLSKL